MEKIIIDESSSVTKDCYFSGEVKIGKNCNISNCRLSDCVIGDNVKIIDCSIEESVIKNGVTIGPYSHIRPGCVLEDDVHIGNFVELKNAKIGKRTKVPHLSYVGDCEIGEDVNIGCGVIFCNYDGKNKHKSIIGNRVFIGSNANIVAPVIIEDEAFIAAGTTVTDNISKGEFCIGRVRNETKLGVLNLYAQKFANPLKYFGTDGIRGVYGKELTDELCVKVGYGLTKILENPKILIGRDTRPSGENMLKSIALGGNSGNAEVFDAGIISTSGLAYLTRLHNFDFGVMLTASHNPSEYNGIKIFNGNGYKLNENQEIFLEQNLEYPTNLITKEINTIDKGEYLSHLNKICNKNLTGLKIFLDCSNGAISDYAKLLFESKGADVVAINTKGEINKDASVLDENTFIRNMKNSGAEIGFCFDGDADRVMCITKNGKVLDGDRILYILAKHRGEKYAVGTVMTNMGLEKHLSMIGTRLQRTNVGDKNIARLMKSKKYKIGAEQSGHVILTDFTTTGDGLITALYLLNIYYENKKLFEEAENLEMFFVESLKVKTSDKSILKSDEITNEIKKQENIIGDNGRIIVRASGTEPLIRITVEGEDKQKVVKIAKTVQKVIENKVQREK